MKRYYTYTAGLTKSPDYRFFDSIEELNLCYDINATEDDFDKGYSFEYEGKIYYLGCDEVYDFE